MTQPRTHSPDLANSSAGPSTLDEQTLSALKTDVMANDQNCLSDHLEGISWLDAQSSKELLTLALNADAGECLSLLLRVADEHGLAEIIQSRTPAARSVLFCAAIDNLLVDVLPRMLSPSTADLFTTEDFAWALKKTLKASRGDARGDEAAVFLAPWCSPSQEQWTQIASCSIFAQDLPALLLAQKTVDLPAWRMNSYLADLTGFAEGADFFSFAATTGSREQIEWLLGQGFDAQQQDITGQTPLMLATGACETDNAQALLPFSDLEAADATGRTALSIAAATHSDETARLLLAAGANPNHQDQEGKTPLVHAIASHVADNIRLLAAVSDQSVSDREGLTAFDHAVEQECWEAVEILIAALPAQDAMAAVFQAAGRFIPVAAGRAAREQEAVQLRAQITEARLAACAPDPAASTRAPRL